MKYYYTNPITVAWMQDKFGVKFELFENCPIDYAVERLLKNRKYYIHSDSLGILEPQVGDLVQGKLSGPEYFIYEDISVSEMVKKIIERNGVAFMWPEIEND